MTSFGVTRIAPAFFWYAAFGGEIVLCRMQDHRKLLVWQRAQAFAAEIHQCTEASTARAQGAWRGQIRRSAQSIGANIAEGATRGTPRQFAHFLDIAAGSAAETESHLDFACRIGVLDFEQVQPLLDEVAQIRRMVVALRNRVLTARQAGGTMPPHTRNS